MGPVTVAFREMKLLRLAMEAMEDITEGAAEEQIVTAVWAQQRELASIDSQPTEADVRKEIPLALKEGIDRGWMTKSSDGTVFSLTAAGRRKLKPRTTGPRRQHYLARMYLKRFTATDLLLAVYDRTTDSVTRQSVGDTAVVNNLYTLQDPDGSKRYEIEFGFGPSEAAASPIITKMTEGEPITVDDRFIMSVFLGNLVCRTPAMIETVHGMANEVIAWFAQQFIDRGLLKSEFERELCEEGKSEEEIQKLMADLSGQEFAAEADGKFAMTLALHSAIRIADVMYLRNWHVLTIDQDRKSFVTCDAPVMLILGHSGKKAKGSPVGFASDEANVWVPLSAKTLLVMEGWGEGLDYHVARERAVRGINLRIAQNCRRFLIGRDERLVRSVARASGIRRTKWKPRAATSYGTNIVKLR